MNRPKFTTDPKRIARLQANYEEGVARESIPCAVREAMDVAVLTVSPAKLDFLFETVMEPTSADEKLAKIKTYNAANGLH